MLAVAAATPNRHVREQVHKALQVAASQHSQYPFDTPRTRMLATVPGDSRQDLDLGQIQHSLARFTLRADRLTRHVLVAGETGAGKTTLFYSLVTQLPVPVWLFDRKTDYRHLLQDSPDLVVVPWTQFRLNPLAPPPGDTPRVWAQAVQELFGDAYDLLSGSQNYLLPHLVELYEDHGIPVDDPVTGDEPFPTLAALRTYLADQGRTGRKQSTYKDTVGSRLLAMSTATGDLFDCRQGYPLATLLQRDVVFEFDGLATDHQDFIMEVLLTWVYRYRRVRQERGGGLRHAFVADEGKRLFSVFKERSDAKGIPQIDELTDKMREFGEALIVGDQEPQKLTASLLANTQTTVLFPIGDASQYERVARSMDLSERQRRYGMQLGIGEAVVQVGGDDPVPVQFDAYRVEKTMRDEDLANRMQQVWVQLHPGQRGDLDSADDAEQPGDDADTAGDTADEGLSEAAMRLLQDVADRPYRKLSDRYERLFASRYKGNKAKTELVDMGLVREKTVEKKLGRPTLLELTDDARTLLAEDGVDVTRVGRGGIVHRYWQQLLQTRFEEAGYAAVREKQDADVAVDLGDGQLAVEVAMEAADRELDHVERRIADGFDSVWIGCRNEGVKEELEAMLAERALPLDQVHVRLLQDLQTASLDAI